MNVQQKIETTGKESRQVEPVAWISYESLGRLKNGGNSRGAVPVHTIQSYTAKIPLYTAPPQRAEPLINQCGETCERAKLCAVCASGLAERVVPAAWINFNAATGEGNVSYVCESELASIPLWPEPTKRRKPIDAKTLWEMWVESPSDVLAFARAIEQAHGIGEK